MKREKELAGYKSACKYMFYPVALIGLGILLLLAGLIYNKVNQITTTSSFTISSIREMQLKSQESDHLWRESFSILQEQLDQQQNSLLSGQGKIVSLMKPTKSSSTEEEEEKSTLECDVVIIGGGVGGLTMAYRLAPLLGDRLCLVEEGEEIGGREKSIRAIYSSSQRPVWSPSHSSGFSSSSSLRCLAQEVGTLSILSGSPGSHTEYFFRGMNVTGLQYKSGFPPEARLSPSDYGSPSHACQSQNWTECSERKKLMEILLSEEKSKSIRNGESLESYSERVLGLEATSYLRDMVRLPSNLWNSDARISLEILRENSPFVGREILLPHGGPQQGLLRRMSRLVERNHSRLYLRTRVNSLERIPLSKGYKYLLGVNDSRQKIMAKRLVLAIPPSFLEKISGSLVRELTSTIFHRNLQTLGQCQWSGFFPSKWWHSIGHQCTEGYCAEVKAFQGEKNLLEWRLVSHSPTNGIRLIEYLPTPERVEGNLLQFRWEGEECHPLEQVEREGGNLGLRNEIMSRVRDFLGQSLDQPIPDPIQSFFSFSKESLTRVKPGAPFNALLLERWAVQPLMNESLSLVSSSYNLLAPGEMEGATQSAYNSLKSKLFSDLLSLPQVNAMENCFPSSREKCLLMKGEYHLRDLANYSYCLNVTHFPYPPLSLSI